MLIRLFLTVTILMLGLGARAATHGEFCNRNGYLVEYICGANPTGPGWVRGQDGCWYLVTQRLCQQDPQPPPYPGPGPNPPPYPPHDRYVRCESYGYGYNECYLGQGVRRVTLTRQWSADPCVAYQTFGASPDRMWVSRGCRGDFYVEYY